MQVLIDQFNDLLHPRLCCGENRAMQITGKTGEDDRPTCCGIDDGDDAVFPIGATGSDAFPPDILGPAALFVPSFFDKLRIDEASGAQDDQRRTVKRLLQVFVQSMLRGVFADMVLADGSPIPTTVFLDRLLATLELHVDSNRQSFPLDEVTAIASWDDVTQLTAGRHRELLRKVRIDDCCVALVLDDGRFVVLKFDSPRTREYFEVCLRILFATIEPRSKETRSSIASTDKAQLSPNSSWTSTRVSSNAQSESGSQWTSAKSLSTTQSDTGSPIRSMQIAAPTAPRSDSRPS